MKIGMLTAAMLCLMASTAMADVTNEVLAGFENDWPAKVTDAAGSDITDDMEIYNFLLLLQYSHFFAPLKDDAKSIELHRFYQHPSSISIGMAQKAHFVRHSTNPVLVRETKRLEPLYTLGGEYYFYAGTGLFLNIGGGSGREQTETAGVDGPQTELEVSRSEFGIRQYIGPEFLLQVRFQGDTTASTTAGSFKITSKTGLLLIGGRGVIRDTIGFGAEIGGGEETEETGGARISYDMIMINLQGDVYVGREYSFGLKIEGETRKRTTQPEHKVTTGRSTLSFRYWFSEKVGLTLPLYSEMVKDTLSGDTISQGGGLYGTFRF